MGNRKIGGKLAKPWRIAVIAFGLAYVLALFVYLIGVYGWFGVTKDPLAGAILAVLGLPWNLVNRWESLGPLLGVLAPLANLFLIRLFGGMFGSRATS